MSLEYTPSDVSTPAADSSPVAEQGHVEQHTAQAEPSSAETLKTELANANAAQAQQEHEKYVPYERFQEMVKARQELEQQLKSPDWDGFQKLNSAIQTDPVLGQVMMEAVANHYRQAQQQAAQQMAPQAPVAPQLPIDPNDPLAHVAMAQQAQQQQLQYLMQQQQQATYQRYAGEFDTKVSALGVPEHWKGIYRNAVEQMVGNMNPNALMQYDGNLIGKAFETVHQHIQGLQRAERASYVADKTKDNMPPSTSGSGATPRTMGSSPISQEGRAQEFLELLRAGQG